MVYLSRLEEEVAVVLRGNIDRRLDNALELLDARKDGITCSDAGCLLAN
jgi:hypothetical protein